MALTLFKSFRSTVTAFNVRLIRSTDRWLTDPATGAIVGVENPNANGPDARFVPVDITAAQLANPTAGMIADIDATYRLNVAPYPRYQSDGSQLVALGSGETEVIIPKGFNVIYYDPLTVASPEVLFIQGTVRVKAYPK